MALVEIVYSRSRCRRWCCWWKWTHWRWLDGQFLFSHRPLLAHCPPSCGKLQTLVGREDAIVVIVVNLFRTTIGAIICPRFVYADWGLTLCIFISALIVRTQRKFDAGLNINSTSLRIGNFFMTFKGVTENEKIAWTITIIRNNNNNNNNINRKPRRNSIRLWAFMFISKYIIFMVWQLRPFATQDFPFRSVHQQRTQRQAHVAAGRSSRCVGITMLPYAECRT